MLVWLCLALPFTTPAQTSVLPANPESSSVLLRPSAAHATASVVPVSGETFTQAIRVQTILQPVNEWDVQLHLRNTAPVAEDDVLLATFFHRVIQPAGLSGFTTFVFELGRTPWTKSAQQTITVGSPVWQKTQIAFESAGTYGVNEVSVNFTLGFAPQMIEIGGIEVVNFAQTKTLEEVQAMIDTSLTYPGRELDAPWRTNAAHRIDQYRKANLTVEVRDPFGNPVSGVPVEIHMRKHAFAFGSAVAASRLLEASSDADQYRAVVTNGFNRVVIENALKWPSFENHPQPALDAVNWLVDQGVDVRGHNILWPSWRWCPADVQTLAGDPPALRSRVNARIADVTTTFAGMLVDWDVINEPFTEHDIMDVLGNHEMVSWFQQARQGDAQARLYLNDYAILSATGTNSVHQNHFFDTIQFLINNDAPIDGIGMQGHFQGHLTSPDVLYAILERFKVFGLPIQVTEFDVDVPNREVQADYLRDFYTMLFSHPSVEGILMWGFWEGRHWRPNAAMYDLDWTLREHGQMWYDLVFTNWWTDAVGASDEEGRVSTRGFKGEYEIRAMLDGALHAQMVELLEDHTTVLTVQNPAVWLPADEQGVNEGGQSRLRVYKGTDTTAVLLGSTDLISWTPIHTNAAPVTQFDFEDPDSIELPARFYRAAGE